MKELGESRSIGRNAASEKDTHKESKRARERKVRLPVPNIVSFLSV